jgi:hypothetical protein
MQVSQSARGGNGWGCRSRQGSPVNLSGADHPRLPDLHVKAGKALAIDHRSSSSISDSTGRRFAAISL